MIMRAAAAKQSHRPPTHCAADTISIFFPAPKGYISVRVAFFISFPWDSSLSLLELLGDKVLAIALEATTARAWQGSLALGCCFAACRSSSLHRVNNVFLVSPGN